MTSVTIEPHHPDCRTSQNWATDPERCCYCAALLRNEREPLDYRYGGPGCWCKPLDPACESDVSLYGAGAR